MKKPRLLLALALSCLLFAACNAPTIQPQQSPAAPAQTVDTTQTQMVFVKQFKNDTVSADAVEWVSFPSERATELKLKEDDAPNGFYIYNQEVKLEDYVVAADCVFEILNWNNNFQMEKLSSKECQEVLNSRGEKNAIVPYILTIKNDRVVEIKEQYVP